MGHHTKDKLFKKGERVSTPEYLEGWERIWGEKKDDSPGENRNKNPRPPGARRSLESRD